MAYAIIGYNSINKEEVVKFIQECATRILGPAFDIPSPGARYPRNFGLLRWGLHEYENLNCFVFSYDKRGDYFIIPESDIFRIKREVESKYSYVDMLEIPEDSALKPFLTKLGWVKYNSVKKELAV